MSISDFSMLKGDRLLRKLEELQNTKDDQHKPLHEMLTILDSKSASLMIFNSIIAIGTTEPFFEKIDHTKVITFIVLLSSISSLISFFVVRVSWSFLGNSWSRKEELKKLAEVVELRTRLYIISWFISLLTVIIFIFLLLFYFLRVMGV